MNNLPDPATPGLNPSSITSIPGLTKEQEPVSQVEPLIQERGIDVEVSPELVQAGVVKKSETIELPPDVKQMGVTAVGPAQPVTATGVVQLPLTDDQIMVGLHAKIISSLRWLAEWCVKRLKQAHVHLKTLGGKVVREKE